MQPKIGDIIMLTIKRSDVLLDDKIDIFGTIYDVKIVLKPTYKELAEDDDIVEWSMEAIKNMTISSKEFYEAIKENKLEAMVLEYLIKQLQKKENS